jgi:acetyltransferase-like isoleucine patch superfamily enzyme
MTENIYVTPQQSSLTEGNFKTYRNIVTGNEPWFFWIWYEVVSTLFGGLGGILGIITRRLFFQKLFNKNSGKIIIGRGITVRRPKQICLGSGVVIDEYVTLDVKDDGFIEIGNKALISKNSQIVAKNGQINLEAGVNIGFATRIATQTKISIGESTLIAAYCYIGPGNHQKSFDSHILIDKPMKLKGGVNIGSHCWIGTRVTILDGVTIGDGAIVGAHSLVISDVPPGATVAGTPAKIISSI